jgi:glyoxylase-like metal-dependent hydrolase (beta-lactamase superfamily II)
MKIHTICLGLDYCYLIQDVGTIMIDGGSPGKAKQFTRALSKIGIKPGTIKLLIITHGHFDHIGSARDIKEITGAKLAMHELEKEWLEKSLKSLPPGVTQWGKIFHGVLKLFMPLIHIPATTVDIVLGDEERPLTEYGIRGEIVPTPGHSPGSVSILLDSGEAFVGDLAMNKFPLRLNAGLPIFAEDLSVLKASWRRLLDQGAKTIYPAHGDPFPAEVIHRALQK